MPRVALLDDDLFLRHDAGPQHPESPERLTAVREGLASLGERLERARARPATQQELRAAHTAEHVDHVESTRGRTVRLDPDTQACPFSADAAALAAGAVADAVERVLDGEQDRAFCAVRPPGHHAESARAMGFCLFNNVAVGAAKALARGLTRVLVVDWDVHHGNGTQEIFYRDPRVLYVSSHQHPLYPGTGAVTEVGEGPGKGFTVNLPLPAGCRDGEYVRLYRDVVLPVAREFDPQLVLISAGFDPHQADPLAGMGLSHEGFAWLADVCLEAASGAAQGRVVTVLEGGYDLDALQASAAAVARVLVGERPDAEAPAAHPRFTRLVELARTAHSPFWAALRD